MKILTVVMLAVLVPLALFGQSSVDKLVAQLNEYFSDMVGSVLQHNGTLQKFIGDAIMAVWGDTHSKGIEADARGAVTAALQMRGALAKLNAGWKENADRTKLSIGVGVNHGEVIVGNIGSRKRLEYTVVGDGYDTRELKTAQEPVRDVLRYAGGTPTLANPNLANVPAAARNTSAAVIKTFNGTIYLRKKK